MKSIRVLGELSVKHSSSWVGILLAGNRSKISGQHSILYRVKILSIGILSIFLASC
jgi:hypothetical protein